MHGRRRWVRVVALLFGLGLAVAATAALVLTDDQQLLRLAVVAALWAFLIAGFLAGQRRVAAEPASAGTPSSVPGAELELAQRREIELLTEVRLRREIEHGLRADLGAMREDLTRLRHDILERWDGELRVERIAVRAESTRISGLGATLAALQEEGWRLPDGREMGGSSSREALLGAAPPSARTIDVDQSDQPDSATPASVGPGTDEFAAASTLEFSVIPPTLPPPPRPAPPAPSAVPRPQRPDRIDATGPVFGSRPSEAARRFEETETTVFPRIGPDGPAPRARHAEPGSDAAAHAATARAEGEAPPTRARHEADDTNGAVGAADLLRRLQGDSGKDSAPRRRRSRADDEPNDVLARLIGERSA